MTYIQALAIAILQGATELFPVSSLGHAVILPAFGCQRCASQNSKKQP